MQNAYKCRVHKYNFGISLECIESLEDKTNYKQPFNSG